MKTRSTQEKLVNRLTFGIALVAVFAAIYDLGVNPSASAEYPLHRIYQGALIAGAISVMLRQAWFMLKPRWTIRIFDTILWLFLVVLIGSRWNWINIPIFEAEAWIFLAVFLVFTREFSTQNMGVFQKYLNPAQLFIASFLVLILGGTFLLLLPRATHSGISFLDALFTSASAACVTGLIVVDTGSYFTLFGQSIILLLIQAGGIGIMTFTSYFSFFFQGSSSYEYRLMLKDMTNSEKIGEVFDSLKKIILLTLFIESIGAIFIFFCLEKTLFSSLFQQFFFSAFHSISAFCNAGFSTLPGSLYESAFRFNYSLHLVISGLFIIGGIGFPIAFNLLRFLRYLFKKRIQKRDTQHIPWIVNINSRIVFITTGILLAAGTFFFYLFEYENTLAEHQGIGKIITAFFGAATPRTAGFNSVDTSALNSSTLLIIFLLMWVGASPGSTGGGIKTTAFAIGTLNFLSLAKGKDRLEIFQREVSDFSVRRAFAVISLSFVVIGVSVFILATFDPEKELLAIAFESFSAYSTVGLSLGITGDLSEKGKVVIIITMFIGRVGMLTLLAAFLRKIKYLKYRYPAEDILIT